MTTDTPTNTRNIGLIIVGDEILSGRYQDKHLPKVIELLGARGLRLAWVEILSDDRDMLIAAYRRSFASGDIVFSCGGIGSTPDDHTRQAAAAALGLPLVMHPEAKVLITQRSMESAAKEGLPPPDMDSPEYRLRLEMGVFPQGCEIVPNPYNKIPGFYVRDHTFVPGFPVMAGPMIEWTLDTRYQHLHHIEQYAEDAFVVYGLPESRITTAMQDAQARWPGVRVFSLPHVATGQMPANIELGAKGAPTDVPKVLAYLRAEAQRLGGRF